MLIELFLSGLCLNATCLDEQIADSVSLRKTRMEKLAAEIKGEHLYVTTVTNDRLSGINSTGGTGIAFELLEILRKKFEFNYTVVWPHQNTYGDEKEGVVKMLMNGEVNISVAFMPVISHFREKVHYSPSLDVGEWLVLMKRPTESATGTGLLAPFTFPVWILIMVSLFVVGPIIYVIVQIRVRFCSDDDEPYSFPVCFWFVYGALLKQGSTLSPIADSTRLLFATWWIFITVLTAFYTANLTAFLTLSDFTLPITDPDSIGKMKLKWVTNKGNVVQEVIKLTSLPTENKIYEEYEEIKTNLGPRASYPNETDADIMNTYVTNDNMMFIRERPIVEYDIYDDYKLKVKNGVKEDKRCTYVLTKFHVFTASRAFAYSRQFKYYELFNDALQHLVEAGVIKFKLNEELPGTKLCPIQLQSQDRKLKNNDLLLTYFIVGVGLIVSIVIFAGEMFMTHYYNKRNDVSYGHTLRGGVTPIYKGHLESNVLNFNKTPPPAYHTLFSMQNGGKKKIINGREYWVTDERHAGPKLIPARAPSAMLFQYTN
ncbi:glutamate receptor U1 isoform X1 [Harmonia axyridis]|uniref:glutamate receptor U1 isoform X1 n=2 Tax=Harmonia axyridis TaxID=115357 RepID=UPI001E276B2E|nr:glutamate receptor U1 isoform X1 [Harmonia axyridis]